MTTSSRLQQISEHGWAWFDGSGRWGHGNSGLIVHGTSGMLVNTRHDVRRTERMLASIASLLPGVTIEGVAVTDAAPHRHWGLSAVRGTAPVLSHTTASEIATRISPGELADIAAKAEPGQPLSRYLRETVGDLDLARVPSLRPSGSFNERTSVQVGATVVELIEIGAAHSESDTVVCLPHDGVMYTGDLLSPGFHPAVRSGSLHSWYQACAQLAALRPVVVVPGHGPAIDIIGVIDFRDYLGHLLQEAERRHAAGMPAEEAAVDIPLRQWAGWAHPENLAVTVAEIYRQLGDPNPLSFTEATTLAAEIAVGLRSRPRIRPVSSGERDADQTRLLGLIQGERAIFEEHSENIPNMITTMVRNPRLYEQTVPIARGVIDGLLQPRHREMVILRGAWNCAAAYQWCHHRMVGLSNGLTEAELDLLSRDVAEGSWTEQEAAILRAVDELHHHSAVSEETWSALSGYYGEAELIELVTLVGEYHKVSLQLNSWRVPLESWAGPYRLPSGWLYSRSYEGGSGAPSAWTNGTSGTGGSGYTGEAPWTTDADVPVRPGWGHSPWLRRGDPHPAVKAGGEIASFPALPELTAPDPEPEPVPAAYLDVGAHQADEDGWGQWEAPVASTAPPSATGLRAVPAASFLDRPS